jgi:SAM-dependent methyltransferase
LDPDIAEPSRLPDFGAAPGVAGTARADTPGERRSEPPVAPAAIVVMKIVGAVSDSPEDNAAPNSDRWQRSPDPAPDIDITIDPELQQPVQLASTSPRDELEELSEEDVAPDSGDRLTPTPRAAAEEAPLSTRPAAAAAGPPMASIPPSLREGELGPKPPPPPKRAQANPSLPKSVPQAKRRQKRPWWEEIFGEDFVRAGFKVSERQIRREVDFIEDSLGVATGGVMLDLGCGSGHHAVELASRGYGVVGYDLSLYQLALASDVAQERGQKLNFLQGDMREMAFDEMFDGIFCWNTTFGYFEEEKNLLVAERVFRALRPGGMFLIDVVNRDFVATQSPCSLWYEGDGCVCMDDMSVDFITSRLRVKRSVILDDGRTRECVYSVRLYSLHELGKLLHEVGFRVTEASGHPTTPGVFFGEQSPRMIVLAQKP